MQRINFTFILSFLIFFIGFTITYGQHYSIEREINWQIIKNNNNSETELKNFFSFEGATYDAQNPAIPVFYEQIKINGAGKPVASLKNTTFATVDDGPDTYKLFQNISSDIKVDASLSFASKEPYAIVSFVPLRKNPETGKAEKLVSFEIDINIIPETTSANSTNRFSKKDTKSSVLASGKWYKIGVTETGVYRIDYNFLKQIGFDVSGTDPRNIRIYGKPGGMLPEANAMPRDSDLTENAIRVIGEEDGVFNPNDYILFYGQSQVKWTYNPVTKRFHHQINYYADTSYYFITSTPDRGKRMGIQPSLTAAPGKIIRTFDEYAYHELDQLTEVTKSVKSGREWFGEEFNMVTNYNINFNFPNIDNTAPAYLRSWVAARSASESRFTLNINGTQFHQNVGRTFNLDDPTRSDFLATSIDTFLVNPAPNQNINIRYTKPNNSAIGWLNNMVMNVRSVLRFHSGQFSFRDGRSISADGVNEYRIQSAPGQTEIWDVTDFHNIKIQAANFDNGELTFRSAADKLREYAAFDGSRFLQPQSFGIVPNQDLHGLANIDMVIVTHPSFFPAARKIADLHSTKDKLSVHIVSPQQIYNEFSSGAQDVSAIRDFMKWLYDNASTKEEAPKYLLLLGDASYDYKNRVKDNTNIVPTFQSHESTYTINSYCSDDFFGLLDDNEGLLGSNSNGLLDLGIGRLPVQTLQQANEMAEKILRYQDAKAMEDWRNIITLTADDEDGNAYIKDSESFAKIIAQTAPAINIDKIYIDAYKQVSTPSGQRYPAAQDAINKRINSGTLIFSYYGHGNEVGLAHERIIDIDAINSWSNMYKMPLFITGTCEFSRFDDPLRTSAGELVVLNPKGGAIASFTTTRVVYAGGNAELGRNIYQDNIFKVENGHVPRLGDILKKAKNRTGLHTNTLNFSLLGDPALQLALPQHQVITTEINSKPVNAQENDSLKALAFITIKGIVADAAGNTIKDYNGIVYPTIYDKPQQIETLANDPGSYKTTISIRNSIIYKGKASVRNGEFSFSFVVPKDISYQNAFGKISYYAENGKEDANGYYDRIVIGGTADSVVTSDQGPEVQLFINDTNFVRGGLVDDTPVLIARVRDDIGINTVGNGIGHELTAVLNNGEQIILNSYYQAKLDNYREGEIIYPFASLPDGHYNLKVKVWDVANNSGEAFTDFVVSSRGTLDIRKLFNYPNPFSERTTFSFEHNAPDEDLFIDINIFDLRGALIKTIKVTQNGSGTRVNNIEWNGRDDFGGAIASGLYVYRISVKTSDGKEAHQAQKLVVVK